MANARLQSSELRRQVGASPRPKGRENKDTLCRNVLIYGHCRYEDQGCSFSHEQNRGASSSNQADKKLNVESPSFTPASLQPSGKKGTFTSQNASAPTFTPRGLGTSTPATGSSDGAVFDPASIREFTPSFDIGSSGTPNGDGSSAYDPFTMSQVNQSLSSTQYNPYADDHTGMGNAGSTFYQGATTFAPLQPLQHHLYAHVGPHRDDLAPYQRQTHDFFMSDKLREEFQKKSEASLQIMPNSQLPQLDNYHSLVALDTTHRKNASIFGYTSWVYKATSTKNANMYCLRRLEGFRLTNENAIRSVKEWRKIDNASIVTVHDAFTTRSFGDSSLIFVQDYHPLSQTLLDAHLTTAGRYQQKQPVPESVLWAYVSQIASALKAIHSANLAARCLDPSKIILTGKNRVRLNACSVLDVVQFDVRRPLAELQREDLASFGRLILCLATSTPPSHIVNYNAHLEQLTRNYSDELRRTVLWLITTQPSTTKTVDVLLSQIWPHVMAMQDMAFRQADEMTSVVHQELENGRAVRLLMKLGVINERPDSDGDRAWSDHGERYMLKLFRDYVFHQVDANGKPVLDMGHIMRSLNKLDAGIDERVCLTSRDEQTNFFVSYKELKKQLNSSFNELLSGKARPT